MKLGTHLILPDGRQATVIYNSLVGVGCKIGLHDPDPADFENTDGNTTSDGAPENWQWEPDVLLREPWEGCERIGWKPEQCVGKESDCKIIRHGLESVVCRMKEGQ